jgi:glyoxylase-like metal-dependent hydrolase (beta-lactamase superfamily II)
MQLPILLLTLAMGNLAVVRGPVNGVLIHSGSRTLAIYGDPTGHAKNVDKVLFTHLRRDVAWAGTGLVANGAEAIHPAQEETKFIQFHDYFGQSSKVPVAPLGGRTVQGGDRIEWNGFVIEVLDTPGYSRSAVSYLFTADGKRIACTGDLIYGDGRILDLFSLQDAIPETKEDGYHGYAARAAQVIASLRKIAEAKPDLLIPARGPVIHNPQAAIAQLIARLEEVFASHFAIDALRWYRGDEKLQVQASRILGNLPVEWMPMAETKEPPEWIRVINNARVIVSGSGAAFLIDCGSRRILDEVKNKFPKVEGIWVTHYHDDHTNLVQTASEELKAPVFATGELRDILEHPAAYRMPCLTPNAIRQVQVVPEGGTRRWHEFEFRYFYFPGQTIYHDGLLIKRDGGESVFFVGDSFTPSGMDDYCVLNRNLAEPAPGYADCLRLVDRLKPDWLINQHVNPMFHFSETQIATMLANWQQRRTRLAALFPWDDPNFGIDEQWARLYPYRSEARAGERVNLKVLILNHSAVARRFRVTPHVPSGWTAPASVQATIGPRKSFEIAIPVTAGDGPQNGNPAIITADIAFGQWDLREWMEAWVEMKP